MCSHTLVTLYSNLNEQFVPVLQSTVAPAEGRLRRSVPSLPAIKPDRLKTAKALVEKALKLRKVFSVQGPYPVIRAALWARGWVERRFPHPVQRTPHCHGDEEDDGDDGDDSADLTSKTNGLKEKNYNVHSRMVRNETTYFYWTTRRDYVDCRSLRNDQMTNHYANAATFTTKVGLCVNLRNLQWFDTADPDTFFPRCYRLGAEDEKHAFIEDFRRTACTSLLQYVVETSRWRRDKSERKNNSAISSLLLPAELNLEHRFVGPEMIDTALHVCQDFLIALKHVCFLEASRHCQAMLNRLKEVCPQLDTDGLNNIWIIKPGAKSRGRGIMCMNRLDEILALVDTDRALMKDSKWVVQKYLERPLLVHGTKFDLRQWFLVTDWNPLTVWFYKECYLRFSTQPYSTKTLDSSVHLCNNSIQKHFQPSHARHPGVPEDNMWSCSQFRSYLQRQGRGAEWESVVVPGMQQAVVHALQTTQDLVEPRKASFELYGADFMLGRDLRPWLLEINASPTMACSSSVTARLCPAVQVDTLRVVRCYRTNWFMFLLYHYFQAAVEVPQYVGVNLLVEGASIRRSRPLLNRQTVASDTPLIDLFPSDQPSTEETKHKPLGQKPHTVAAFCRSGKENQETKRQLTSTCPKRECEMRAAVQNTSCVRRSSRSLACEQSLVVHSEPQRKARRLGLSFRANGTTLVPRSLSFSLSPPHSKSEGKPQFTAGSGSRISRSFLPQTTFAPRHRISKQAFPSFQGPLPSLEVLHLRPNIVAGTTVCRKSAFSAHPSDHKHQLFLHSQRQSTARHKGENTGEHKY
uniref:Tubulin monoglycylase TTLL3-like n=1 Tax=Stegastes partitus TaxID=144197 RepID=A0A3B4Z6N6_9TELE